MQVETFEIEGLKRITPDVFGDERGWFYESFNQDKFLAMGIDVSFAQNNHSCSVKNTLRGLHFQTSPGQAKLVRCTLGRVWDVSVDLRPQSPTFGKWQATELDDQKRQMFFIPVGFAHGFCVLSDVAEFQYSCSTVYNGATEAGIAWDDPELAVAWPVSAPLLSKRDLGNQSFAEFRAKGM
jgi:dTDP-4-dehydrorhamnose 3,5-epimerase